MRKRSQRLWLIGAASVLVAGALALAATGLKDAMAFAYTPTQMMEKQVSVGRSVRVGGLVETGSVVKGEGSELLFNITDGTHSTPVVFDGLPPDLFEEGQGVVAEGRMADDGRLVAKRVLARHDENYMPKEAYEAMRAQAERDASAAAASE
ncbi:MAG: cytochrome c maturation protein CcmE [Hyphomonadaceae bacterium]